MTYQLQEEYSVVILILLLKICASLSPLFISRIDVMHVYDRALLFTLVENIYIY